MESLNILLIDNHDSFVHNLYLYLNKNEGVNIFLEENDELPNLNPNKYDACVISPGPGLPQETAHLIPFIQVNFHRMPMLGICLGHQAIGLAFGGQLKQLGSVRHGYSESVHHYGKDAIFKNILSPFSAGLYHSWYVSTDDLPDTFKILAVDEEDNIMAMNYAGLPVYGFQFHPESYITKNGQQMIDNFIEVVRGRYKV